MVPDVCGSSSTPSYFCINLLIYFCGNDCLLVKVGRSGLRQGLILLSLECSNSASAFLLGGVIRTSLQFCFLFLSTSLLGS